MKLRSRQARVAESRTCAMEESAMTRRRRAPRSPRSPSGPAQRHRHFPATDGAGMRSRPGHAADRQERDVPRDDAVATPPSGRAPELVEHGRRRRAARMNPTPSAACAPAPRAGPRPEQPYQEQEERHVDPDRNPGQRSPPFQDQRMLPFCATPGANAPTGCAVLYSWALYYSGPLGLFLLTIRRKPHVSTDSP